MTELPGFKKSKTKTEAEHVHFQPEYEDKSEDSYKGVPVKKQELKVSVATQPNFVRTVKDRSGVRQETCYPMEYPWPFSLDRHGNETQVYRNRLAEAIQRIQSKPQFIIPQLWTPPNDDPPSLPLSKPTPAPIPQTPKAVRGMRRSSS